MLFGKNLFKGRNKVYFKGIKTVQASRKGNKKMKEIDNILKEYNQEHLLKYLNNASDEQRRVLCK